MRWNSLIKCIHLYNQPNVFHLDRSKILKSKTLGKTWTVTSSDTTSVFGISGSHKIFENLAQGPRHACSSVANQGFLDMDWWSVDFFLIGPSNLWRHKIVWADKSFGFETRAVQRKVLTLKRGHWKISYHSALCLNFWKLLFRTLLDEPYAISSFLETMDANDFGSVNAFKSFWLIMPRFLAEKGWERYERPMRWWKKYTQWPLERS